MPLIDYQFNKLLRKILFNELDFKLFQQYLAKEVCHILTFPNRLFVKLNRNEKIDADQRIYFPMPIAVCVLNIIEVKNIFEIKRETNIYCVADIGTSIEKFNPVKTTGSPLLNHTFIATIIDFYEQCEIAIYQHRSTNLSMLLGYVRFQLNKYILKDEKSQRYINGRDIWLPLTKSNQAMVHFRITIFKLSMNENILQQTFNNINMFSVDRNKLPIAVISVFIKEFNHTKNERKNKRTKDNRSLFAKMTLETISKQTVSVNYEKNKSIYKWNEGFNFFLHTSPYDGNKEFIIAIIEINNDDSNNYKENLICQQKILLNDIINKMKINRSFNFSDYIDFKKGQTFIGKLELMFILTFVKIERNQLAILTKPIEYNSSEYNREDDIDSTCKLCLNCKKLMSNLIFNDGEKLEISKVDKDEKIETNNCKIKIKFFLRTRYLLCIDVIKVINIPIFHKKYSPFIQVIVELWRMNVKLSSCKANSKQNTTNPLFGRRFKFDISCGNINRYLLRILLINKTGFIIKKLLPIAEAFVGIPLLDIDAAHISQWITLQPIGIPLDNVKIPKQKKNKVTDK